MDYKNCWKCLSRLDCVIHCYHFGYDEFQLDKEHVQAVERTKEMFRLYQDLKFNEEYW